MAKYIPTREEQRILDKMSEDDRAAALARLQKRHQTLLALRRLRKRTTIDLTPRPSDEDELDKLWKVP